MVLNSKEITYQSRGTMYKALMIYPHHVTRYKTRFFIKGQISVFNEKNQVLLKRTGLSRIELMNIEKQVKKHAKVIMVVAQ